MREFDDTDRRILQLLLEDARRPFSDIADHVGLSAPAVSDRVDRLQDLGVIRGFTADVDRSTIRSGTAILIELDVDPAAASSVAASLRGATGVEHVFETADAEVLAKAVVEGGDVVGFLDDRIELDAVRDVDVRLLRSAEWTPSVGEATLALPCAECDNTVTIEGESARIGGERYQFCCESCLEAFRERYERLEADA